MSTTLTLRLSDELARWVEEQARSSGRSRGGLVKDALEQARRAESKSFLKLAGGLAGAANLSQRKGFAKK